MASASPAWYAGYGLTPTPHDVFSSAAHAQVDKR